MPTSEDISRYLRTAYSDQRLVELYAHIQDGKFSYVSCCCLRGAANANHPLRGRMDLATAVSIDHYRKSRSIIGGREVEQALWDLLDDDLSDRSAQEILLPLVKAEIERREQEAARSLLQDFVEAEMEMSK